MYFVRACRRRLVELFEQSWERYARSPHAPEPLEGRLLFAAVPGVIGGGDGLFATYYNNSNFTAEALQRTDPTVNFDWGLGSPHASMAADTFSIRWTGFVQPRFTETYSFRTTSDDGVRLWINDQLVIDQWTDHPATEHTGSISLQAGQFYSIRMEHYENGGGAVAKLAWSSASQITQIIPQSQLFTQGPSGTPTPVRREIEAFTSSSPAWQTQTDGGVTFRVVPNGMGTELIGNPDAAPRLSSSFDLPAGDYKLRARWLAPNSQDDSFWVRAGNGPWVDQWLTISNDWADGDLDYPVVNHPGGTLNIDVSQREAGTRIDWIELIPLAAPTSGTLGLSATQLTVSENAGSVSIDVVRSGGSAGEAIATWQTVNDTAVAGQDFTGTASGTVVFADGQTRATITIPILNDSLVEGAERFTISLNGVSGAGLTEPRTAVVTINDDDSAPPPVTLRRQLENFSRDAGWVTGVDSAATYVHVPNGAAVERQDDPAAAPKLSETIELPAGEYTLRGRVRAPNGNDDSFWIRINGGEWLYVGLNTQGGNSFNIQDLGDVGRITHAGGPLTVEIAQREAGTAIDWIEFVPTNAPPTVPVFGIGKAEIEAMLLQNMTINGNAFASGGTLAYVGEESDTGSARFRFTGPAGTYNLELGYYDENDGASTYRILVNGVVVHSFVADATDGGPGAEQQSYRTKGFLGVQLNPNDEVRVEVTYNSGEYGRVDYLNITTGIPANGTFSIQNVISGLANPTAIDFASTGAMFIAQKNGIVRVYQNGQLQSANFIDIRNQVNDTRDRGLLGMAVHPDFVNNPYVYLAFTYDPPETVGKTGLAAPDAAGNRAARVIRVTAQTNANGTINAVPGSEVVIVGKNSTWANISRPDANSTSNINIPPSGVDADGNYVQDFIATDSESHTIGAIEFGADGALYVAIGDGTSYGFTDPRTARVQSVDSLSGKVLRVNPVTGEGYADNPFYNGDLNTNRSKVFAYGLRNPFRIATHPTEGKTVYIGDVGWSKWEEINKATGGENFGWPWYEGGYSAQTGPYLERTGGYRDLEAAQQFYNSAQNAEVDAPLWASNHNTGTIAIVMGDFISSPLYPSQYQGQVFFSDFGVNDVQVAFLDAEGRVTRVETVVDGGARSFTEMTMGPDGYLYLTDLYGGTVTRLHYA